MSHSDAYQTFRDSMRMDFDKWRDGEPYDLVAFSKMTAAEKDLVEREMLDKPKLDWRDMEVLAATNSAAAFDRLRDLLDVRQPADTQAHALRYLIDMPDRMAGNVPDAKMRDVLERVTLDDGLTTALQIARQHAGPWSKLAMLRGVRDRPGVAIHFAGVLLDMAGLSDDMAAFDPKFRPTLIKLLPDNTPADRAAAFAAVCRWLKIDPQAILDKEDGNDIAWSEKTWPRE